MHERAGSTLLFSGENLLRDCSLLSAASRWRLEAPRKAWDSGCRGSRLKVREATVMIRRKRSGKRPIEDIFTKDSYERMCETEPADANEGKRSVQNEREEEEE